jgi:hypothetical protein
MTSEQAPLRERYGTRVVDREGQRGMVTKYDGEVKYSYEKEMVLVRLDRDIGGQDLFWYDEDRLTISARAAI